MTMNRLGMTSETYARKIAVISAFLFIIAALAYFRFADICLAITADPNSPWPQLSEQDKSVIRSRWSTEKIVQVLSALKTPNAPLPVERVSIGTIAKDLKILALAHGVYGERKPMSWYTKQKSMPRYSDLRGIPLKNCKLEKADLQYTYLEGADLSKCDLTNANLTGANLRGANLTGAILNGAILNHTLLIQIDLTRAELIRASLRQALLYGSTIVRANFIGADLEGAQFVDFEQTAALTVLKGYIGADIEQTPLFSPAKLSQSNLFRANLCGAILGNANLEGVSLYEAMFENTLIDVRKFDRAFNYRYIRPGVSSTEISIPAAALQFVETYHREAKRFFALNGMAEMAAEYHFWEQEAKTYKPETPLHRKVLRIVFLKWPYGYSSRPMWLFYYTISVVLVFAAFYLLLTISGKKSGIYRVHCKNGHEEVILLSWNKGILLADCLYFSLLSLATFGYGVFKPSQWVEFFRLEPIQLKPIGWARILVGLEAALGMYLLALLTTVLFVKG